MALNRSARVGLTALAGVVCAGALAVFLGDLHFSRSGYPVTVEFNYVDSLKTSAPVLYGGGVAIGEVRSMDVRDGKVAVVLEIRRDVRVPLDSEISINTAGILGEKYVQVDAGHAGDGVLAPGAVVQGVDPGSLDRTLRKVESLADDLGPLLKDPRIAGGVSHVLANLDKASTDLDAMVEENRPDLRASLRDLRFLTASLRQSADAVRPLTARAGKLLTDANIQKMQDSLDRLDASLGKVNAMLDHIQQKKGTLGLLVYDDQAGRDLRDLLEDLKRHPWKLLWKK